MLILDVTRNVKINRTAPQLMKKSDLGYDLFLFFLAQVSKL